MSASQEVLGSRAEMAAQAVQQVVLTSSLTQLTKPTMAGADGASPAPESRGSEAEAPGLTETPWPPQRLEAAKGSHF